MLWGLHPGRAGSQDEGTSRDAASGVVRRSRTASVLRSRDVSPRRRRRTLRERGHRDRSSTRSDWCSRTIRSCRGPSGRPKPGTTAAGDLRRPERQHGHRDPRELGRPEPERHRTARSDLRRRAPPTASSSATAGRRYARSLVHPRLQRWLHGQHQPTLRSARSSSVRSDARPRISRLRTSRSPVVAGCTASISAVIDFGVTGDPRPPVGLTGACATVPGYTWSAGGLGRQSRVLDAVRSTCQRTLDARTSTSRATSGPRPRTPVVRRHRVPQRSQTSFTRNKVAAPTWRTAHRARSSTWSCQRQASP